MFGFLKDKLKGAINLFKKKVDEEVPDEEVEVESKPEPKPIAKPEQKKDVKPDAKEIKGKDKPTATKKETPKIIKEVSKTKEDHKFNEHKEQKIQEKKYQKLAEVKPVSKPAHISTESKRDDGDDDSDEDKEEESLKEGELEEESELGEESELKEATALKVEKVETAEEKPKRGFFGKLIDTFTGKKTETDSEIIDLKDETESKAKEYEISETDEEITSRKITPELDSEIKKLEEDSLEEQKIDEELKAEEKEIPKDIKKEMESVLEEADESLKEDEVFHDKKVKDSVEKLKEDDIEEELIEDQLREELVTEKVYEKVQEESKSDGKSDEDIENIEGVIGGELDTQKTELRKDRQDERQQKKDDFEKKYSDQAEKKGFFQRFTETFTTKKISDEKFDEMFWELEVAMLENNVAVEVIEKIKADLKENIVGKALPKNSIEQIIVDTLKDSIDSLFDQESIDVIERIKAKKKEGKPFVICFVGINGSGKTTTIAKFAHLLKTNDISCVIAAADTFRAAAIDQLEEHASRLGVKLVRHDYNADPAAVAFDAIKHAESKSKDVVLIDTAGRLHSNQNLMEELHKIVKVAKPDLTIFVGESITGNDCIDQAREFDKMVNIDGIILSKADVDQKGGAAISISYVLKKPILYFGVGQNYEDLRPFSIDFINENLNLGSEES